MTTISLDEQQKQFLRDLLNQKAVASPYVMIHRTLLDNGYITEKHLGGNSFEYRPTQECIDYYADKMNELEPPPYIPPRQTFDFGS